MYTTKWLQKRSEVDFFLLQWIYIQPDAILGKLLQKKIVESSDSTEKRWWKTTYQQLLGAASHYNFFVMPFIHCVQTHVSCC